MVISMSLLFPRFDQPTWPHTQLRAAEYSNSGPMCKCFSLESNLYQHYVGKITNMEIYFPSQASSPRAPPLHSIKHGGTNLLISSRHFIRFAILCRSPFLAIFVFSRRGVGILLLATDRHHLRLQIGIILLLRQGSRCCCSSHAPTLVLPSMHTLLLLPLVYTSPPPQMRWLRGYL